MTRIAIIVRVGRDNYVRVLEDLVRSIDQYGHFQRHELALYLSFDAEFVQTDVPFLKGASIRQLPFSRVRRIGCSDRDELVTSVVKSGAASSLEATLLFRRRPYTFQLNTAIAFAILDGNEVAIFFDDDQGFAVPVTRADGSFEWRYMDIIGEHLRALLGSATVTTGPVAGCVSPIPERLVDLIGSDAVRDLGNLYSGGHEFLTARHFEGTGYRSLRDPAFTVPSDEIRGETDKTWISPANMGLSLRREFPPFFNPPGARGEDAFFFLGLTRTEVVTRIGAGVFHDPFLRYPGIYSNDFPRHFVQIAASSREIARFAAACVGWLRYMPLYMRVSQPDWGTCARRVDAKQRMALSLGELLATTLEDNTFHLMPRALRYHFGRAERDYRHWCVAVKAWRENIHPWLAAI